MAHMFLCLLLLLLAGCVNQREKDPSSVVIHASGVNWSIEHKDQTDTERFATNEWIDKVRAKLHFANAPTKISIRVVRSSFVDMQNKLEFAVKLICRNPKTSIDFKIKIKGSADIGGTGSALDEVTNQIAAHVLERLEYEYGTAGRPRLVPQRLKQVQYNGPMTDLINKDVKVEEGPKPVVRMGEQQDLTTKPSENNAAKPTTENDLTSPKPTPPPQPAQVASPAQEIDLVKNPPIQNAPTQNLASQTSTTTSSSNSLSSTITSTVNEISQVGNSVQSLAANSSSTLSNTSTDAADAGNRYNKLLS